MKKLTASAFAVVVALSAGAAFADNHDWEAKFDKADTNKDGVLSRAEFDASWGDKTDAERNDKFTRMDTNKDGQISKEEKKAFKEHKKEKRD